MGTLQNVTVAGLLADLGLTGYNGVSVAGNGSALDITITSPAWALLSDGTLLTTELVSTIIQAPTTDAAYHLYLDAQDSKRTTIPLWSIAATAPSTRALQVGDVVVSSNVIGDVALYPAGLRNFPVVGGAPLVWRRVFDGQGQYAPGHLVRAGSQLYVCTTPPSKVLDTRVDTFVRSNQDGWGTASDGHVWTVEGTDYGQESIASNRGVSSCIGGNLDKMVLGPTLVGANLEALVRWQMTESLADTDGLDLRLADGVLAEVVLDGSYYLSVSNLVPSGGQPTWAGGDSAHAYWTRTRLEDGTLSVRTWQDGDAEPEEWDGIFASEQVVLPSAPSLSNAGYNSPTTLAVDHFSVVMVASAVPWPSTDPEHWDLMAS